MLNFGGIINSLVRGILSETENTLWINNDPANVIAQPKTSENFIPGDVDILNISLVSGDGNRAHNLIPYVSRIDIYESIITPSIICEMFIEDSIGLYERFPLTTDEYITFSIKTPGQLDPTDYKFAINRIGNKEIDSNNKHTKYILQLTSIELKRSAGLPIIKTFNGTISDLVVSTLKDDLQTNKQLIIEPTTGIINKTIGPRLPFPLIHEHYLDAENTRDGHFVYVFFENKNGFNLVTYEKLLKDGQRNNENIKVFEATTDRNSNINNNKYRNIIAYNQTQFNDAINLISDGGLSSVATPYDFARGAGELTRYTELENGVELPTSDINGALPVGINFINQYQKNSTRNTILPVNQETRPNNRLADILIRRTAFIKRLQQIEAQIMIYGDTSITIGDTIQCNFLTGTDAEDGDVYTRLDSGNYLITHLRHSILNSDRPQHIISCNLMKSGMLGD